MCHGLDVVVAGRYPDVWGWHRSFVLPRGGVVVLRVYWLDPLERAGKIVLGYDIIDSVVVELAVVLSIFFFPLTLSLAPQY